MKTHKIDLLGDADVEKTLVVYPLSTEAFGHAKTSNFGVLIPWRMTAVSHVEARNSCFTPLGMEALNNTKTGDCALIPGLGTRCHYSSKKYFSVFL